MLCLLNTTGARTLYQHPLQPSLLSSRQDLVEFYRLLKDLFCTQEVIILYVFLVITDWVVIMICSKYSKEIIKLFLTLFRMGFFATAHGWRRGQRGSVIPYLKKTQKIYESGDTHLEFCWYRYLLTGIQQTSLYQEIQI